METFGRCVVPNPLLPTWLCLYQVQDGLSPATDFNIFGLNGRSTSPVTFTNVHAPRARYTSTYDTLTRRREREV